MAEHYQPYSSPPPNHMHVFPPATLSSTIPHNKDHQPGGHDGNKLGGLQEEADRRMQFLNNQQWEAQAHRSIVLVGHHYCTSQSGGCNDLKPNGFTAIDHALNPTRRILQQNKFSLSIQNDGT